MSRLFYNIPVTEEKYILNNGDMIWEDEFTHNLPHAKEISAWLPGEWDDCKIGDVITHYNPEFQDKIMECSMKCFENPDGELIARVTLEFTPGFRLSARRREIIWDELDAQMSDGFGESYDRSEIPGVPREYRIAL